MQHFRNLDREPPTMTATSWDACTKTASPSCVSCPGRETRWNSTAVWVWMEPWCCGNLSTESFQDVPPRKKICASTFQYTFVRSSAYKYATFSVKKKKMSTVLGMQLLREAGAEMFGCLHTK